MVSDFLLLSKKIFFQVIDYDAPRFGASGIPREYRKITAQYPFSIS
jgi:hypothetical protein